MKDHWAVGAELVAGRVRHGPRDDGVYVADGESEAFGVSVAVREDASYCTEAGTSALVLSSNWNVEDEIVDGFIGSLKVAVTVRVTDTALAFEAGDRGDDRRRRVRAVSKTTSAQ